MSSAEDIVIVNNEGIITRFSPDKSTVEGENIAVELVMVYIKQTKQIVLFNRGVGASDMQNHWALEAGKVSCMDLSNEDGDKIGNKLSLQAFKRSASREFNEELNIHVNSNSFDFVDRFRMPNKSLYFTLLSWAIECDDLERLTPDQSEVDGIGCFTLEEFDKNPDLGDAIKFRKDVIMDYLRSKFEN